MPPRDGGLRALFRSKFPTWVWASLETGSVCPGIPDAYYCAPGGVSGFLEYKSTEGWKVIFQPLQPAWIHKHTRLGGRSGIIVKRKQTEIYLIPGEEIFQLAEEGVKGRVPVAKAGNSWDWGEVEKFLLR